MFTSTSHLTLTFAITQCLLWNIVAAAHKPGEMKPERIDLEMGGSANLTCSMNSQFFLGKNSNLLSFVEEDTQREVPKDNIAVVNETTIVYMIRNATKQDRNYYCKLGSFGVATAHVSVGYKPLDIVDFKCRGYDYAYMVCNFTLPENPIPTKYNLTFTALSVNYLQNCKLEVHNGQQAICNLTLENNYRPNFDVYNFTLTGSNVLGVNQQNFKINHKECIIPPRPAVEFQRITTDSAQLTWHMMRYSYYGKSLQYDVRVQPENMPELAEYVDYDVRTNKSEYSIFLRNLPYAYYNYTITLRLHMSARRAEYGEPFVGVVRTLAKLPEAPPKTDVGSFYINSTEMHVRLFWEQLPAYAHNGPNFHYVVTQVKRDGSVVDMTPLEIDQTSALFSWNRWHNYSFTIKSRNAIGDSADASYIHIQAMPKLIADQMPSWISNVNNANHTYTLIWSAPTDLAQLIDYTVYWCQSKHGISNDCRTGLQFQHVPSTSTRFTTPPLRHEHTLAIAANYEHFNTGMHWTMCMAGVSRDLAKLEPEIRAQSNQSIEVQWSTNICFSLLEGYNLTYCQVSVGQEIGNLTLLHALPCMPGTRRTVIAENTAKKYLLHGLRAFSWYRIEMYMFSQQKVGRISEAQYIRTLQGAPTPPRALRLSNVTSNSVTLSWLPPSEFNGILRYYTIVQNDEHKILNCAYDVNNTCHLNATNQELHFDLENLLSYTNYTIHIIAHTDEQASLPSAAVHFTTLIGVPSPPRAIDISIQNNQRLLKWSPPAVAAGRLEYFEVAITVWHKNKKERQHISGIVNATACYVKIPPCLDTNYAHTVQVRAVNVALKANEVAAQTLTKISTENAKSQQDDDAVYVGNEDLQCTCIDPSAQILADQQLAAYRNSDIYLQYKSKWENSTIFRCAATQIFTASGFWPISIVAFIIFTLLVFFGKQKYNKMSNIKCVLPPGLNKEYPTKPQNAGQRHHDPEQDSLDNPEDKRLLTSGCNDSGYLCDEVDVGVDSQNCGGVTPISGKSSGYAGSDEQFAVHDIMFDQFNEQHSTPQDVKDKIEPNYDDTYMPMEVQHKSDLNVNVMPMTGYIDPNALKHMRPNNLPIMPQEIGYIKPNKEFSWQPNSNTMTYESTQNTALPTISGGGVSAVSGYVSPQMLEKMIMQPTHNGYTSLCKPPTTLQQQATRSFHGGGGGSDVPSPHISGYVTHKEMAAFGQQQQFM